MMQMTEEQWQSEYIYNGLMDSYKRDMAERKRKAEEAQQARYDAEYEEYLREMADHEAFWSEKAKEASNQHHDELEELGIRWKGRSSKNAIIKAYGY